MFLWNSCPGKLNIDSNPSKRPPPKTPLSSVLPQPYSHAVGISNFIIWTLIIQNWPNIQKSLEYVKLKVNGLHKDDAPALEISLTEGDGVYF